jgi:hypothetical protein
MQSIRIYINKATACGGPASFDVMPGSRGRITAAFAPRGSCGAIAGMKSNDGRVVRRMAG